MGVLKKLLVKNKVIQDLEVLSYIQSNLNPKFKLRPYQRAAFSKFESRVSQSTNNNLPKHLLFHMATGSGKTLVMAGLLISLYHKGYRNFVFFVNSTSIIEKTRDNFLNRGSSKYLFSDSITINHEKVLIREVRNFSIANNENINIVFTTIQGLHTRLQTPKENSLTFDDFKDKRIVLLSDEAHHTNANTINGTNGPSESASWENTVQQLLNINSGNFLLEFTATIDFQRTTIKEKYRDKLLFDYSLKQFRRDRYSKEVKLLQADLPQFQRALQAIILSLYRQKLFESNRIIIKPVILLKSNTIKNSHLFYTEFFNKLLSLNTKDLKALKRNTGKSALTAAFKYFSKNRISLDHLLLELKNEFSEQNCLIINSKNDNEKKQLAINSLEDNDNRYRIIFSVDKLNEGWDVLNLFDIVRLYEVKATKKTNSIAKSTISEAQLIGRGARYCPFITQENHDLYRRKYDKDKDNELRVCEELYYHSAHNPSYINELQRALVSIGIVAEEGEMRNNPLSTKARKKTESTIKSIFHHNYEYTFHSGRNIESDISKQIQITKPSIESRKIKLIEFNENILRKAMNRISFYHFNNLVLFFPEIESRSEFIRSKRYLHGITITIYNQDNESIEFSNDTKLTITTSVLNEIANKMNARVIIP